MLCNLQINDDMIHVIARGGSCPGILLYNKMFEGPVESICSIAYNRTRNLFVTSDNQTLRLWSAKNGQIRSVALPRGTTTECLIFNEPLDIIYGVRDKHVVVAFHGTYLNEITRTGSCARAILCLALWREKSVLYASGVGAIITGWWIATESLYREDSDGPWVPTSKRAGGHNMIPWGEMRDPAVNSSSEWTCVLRISEPQKIMFAAKGWDVQVWHLESKLVLFTLAALHLMPITSLHFNAESMVLCTASADRCVPDCFFHVCLFAFVCRDVLSSIYA